MKRNFLCLTLTLLAFLIGLPAQSASPKREHRSVWVTTVWANSWPSTRGASSSVATTQKNEAIGYLDMLKENGFNAVYFQVRGLCDAMYKSSYEPWSSYVSGTRGTAPTYDPLAFWIEECHKRDMECYAWVNPYRYESSISNAKLTNGYRTSNLDWLMEYNDKSILNPALTEVQTRIVDVCKEIISNYNVDGLVFDDYFYITGTPLSQDQDLYEASGSTKSQADWRRENVNTMVRKVYNMIQQVKPSVKFGISPAGVAKKSAETYGLSTSLISAASDWQYDDIYSDPLAWLAEGSVDFISPQLYWKTDHSTNGYASLAKWWSDACSGTFNRHFYSSHSISFFESSNTTTDWAEIATQVQYNRDYNGDNAPGCVMYPLECFSGKKKSGLAPYLKANKFQNIALQPTMTFKNRLADANSKVSDITLSGTTLSWTGMTNMRYAVYAVPDGTTPGSDVSAEYLIGNPYSSSINVSGYTTGYQLGVSIVDPFGYEYPVSWLGGETVTETLDRVTINSPSDGATVNAGFTFAWSSLGTTGVTYTIEISTSSDFSVTTFSAKTTTNSYVSTNFSLSEGITYYWRVKAEKSGYNSSTSWTGSFKLADTSTDDTVTISGANVEQKWIYSVNNGNFPSTLSASNRGIATLNGKVYISQQNGSLLEFNGDTGALIRTITLTGDCKTSSSGTSLSYPTNDVFVDGAGHLCVSNLVIISSANPNPLTVCTVNLSTGATTRVFETEALSERIDYAAARGNITSAGGEVWAAVASSNTVYRWTRTSSGSWSKASTTIDKYYTNAGSQATTNSTAPRIMPISATQFILDGHNSAPSLYTFNASGTATYNDGFGSNTSLAPTADNWNGMCSAKLGGATIFVYVSAIAPNTFNVVTNPANFQFSAMQKLATLPDNGFGSAANSPSTAQPAAINNADGSVTLFLYTPLNGLACYKLTAKSGETPSLNAVTINSPANGTTVNHGFAFAWSEIEGAQYTIEISNSSNFANIAFSQSTASNSCTSSSFALTEGATYYWRVKATKGGYNPSTSAVASFTIAQTVTEDSDYTIENQWLYSYNNNNFPSELNNDLHRGIAALNGKVYISQQGGALLEYNGSTGSLIRTISLTGDCKTSSSGASLSYPSNDVFVDGAGNLCVSNMVIVSTTAQPLTVCTVNTSTGATTRVFESEGLSERIDYAAARGNVTTTGGEIWAAVASSNTIYRWTRTSSGSWTKASTTINKYYSSGTAPTTNGASPRIMPISATQFILDGYNSAPALYTFNASRTATYSDGFGNNTALAPTLDTFNGTCTANLGGVPLFIYVSATTPVAFNIVTNPSNFSFASMSKLWTIPDGGFGSQAISFRSSQPVAVNNADGSVTLYLYSPHNGLACYLLKSKNTIVIPTLDAVTLNNPNGGKTVGTSFNFEWSAIEGATYTIEVSTSPTFSNVAFSASTSSNKYASRNFNLNQNTTYYWRVIAEKDGYYSSTSAVESFVTPKPQLSAVTLNSPTNGETVSADGFSFQWSAISGATYVVEISSLATFASLMYSSEVNINMLASSTFELLENTKYYWRVKAEKSGYNSSVSSIESFTTPLVTIPDVPDTPVNPDGLPTDGATYNDAQGLSIDNLWIYSLKTNNYPEQLGKDQRGMAAYNGNIYISERDSENAGYLHEFSGQTGEYLRKIALTGDYNTLTNGSSLSYPCNDVFVDDAGHLCVSNMITSASKSSQLTICLVNVNTGETTRVFESSLTWPSDRIRFDNCEVYGDITITEAKVFAAGSSESSSSSSRKRIYCWTRETNHSSSTDASDAWSSRIYNTASDFYPEASNFGQSPRVLPISNTRLIVDGNAIYPTLYTFTGSNRGTARVESSFEDNENISPKGSSSSGMCIAQIKNKPLFIYSFNDSETEFFNYAIAYNPSDFAYENMEILWKVPKDGLGNSANQYFSSIPATIENEDGSLTLFIYTPFNGIAAYHIYDASMTDIKELYDNRDLKVTVIGDIARLNGYANEINIYSTAGILVANALNCSSIDLSSLASGVYIVDIQTDETTITQRIVIK